MTRKVHAYSVGSKWGPYTITGLGRKVIHRGCDSMEFPVVCDCGAVSRKTIAQLYNTNRKSYTHCKECRDNTPSKPRITGRTTICHPLVGGALALAFIGGMR